MLLETDIEIPEDNPFLNDKLNRETIADNLEKIINNTSNRSLVLTIDAAWGNGKTTFIKMWSKKLANSGNYKVLYFNAWENDDQDDPLLALLGEWRENLSLGKQNSTIEKVVNLGKPLLKRSLPMALKLATGGLLDLSDWKLSDKNEGCLLELASKLGEMDLSEYAREKKIRDEFRQSLSEFQKDEEKKVIIFIDELDRCRPNFAVETLERIKHLFNIDGYIFVLALDKKQLSYSIQTLYGQNIDAVGYLRRFIDLEFILPEPNISIYTDFLLSKYQLKSDNTRYFEEYLDAAIIGYNLSLRDIEKLFFILSLTMPSTALLKSDKKYKHIYLEVLGIIYSLFPVLKIKESGLYRDFIRHEPIQLEHVLKSIRINNKYSNYTTIVGQIFSLNSQIRYKEKEKLYGGFTIGNEDRDNKFDLIYLLDKDKEQFLFIQQIDFIDNFSTE